MELAEVCSWACVRKGEIAMTSHRPLNYAPGLVANIRQYTRNDHFHVCMSDYEARVTCWYIVQSCFPQDEKPVKQENVPPYERF